MKKVIVFGTFDILHKGHLNFFYQAKKLATYLIVVVARDKFVKLAKGSNPKNQEKKRLFNIKKLKLADKVILGSKTYNFHRTLRTHKPTILALGYDQKPAIYELKKSLKKHRIKNIKILRLKSFRANIYKSSKLSKPYEKNI